ncbi:MAG: hypothetical protein ABUL67_00510, partial [Haliangium ochraceum]
MPLPIDLLLDPATGLVDLPAAAWDTQTVLDAKAELAKLDGFGTSMGLTLGFTGPVDPTTVSKDTIELWQTSDTAGPVQVPAEIAMLDDGVNVEITPIAQPLDEQTTFAVVVRTGIRALEDQTDVVMMPAGRLMQADAPIYADGKSQVGPVLDLAAQKVEHVRQDVRPFLDDIQADASGDVLAAWTYTTMSVRAPMDAWIGKPAELNVSPDPHDVIHRTPIQALGDFALAISSLFWVGDVYEGTIESPVFLDPRTRAFRTDGGVDVQDIHFTMTAPRNLDPDEPVPVVIFGHAIMTERRMVLAIGDALAQRGFVAISVDLPMHGSRTHCWTEGPLSVPNPTTGELTTLANPCTGGNTCSDEGKCVDAQGLEQPFALWPVI